MSAWDKFQLGWLNYEVARAGAEVRAQARAGGVQHEAGPGCVRSCCRTRTSRANVGTPFAGSNFYYSGAANDLTTEMSRSVTLPAGAVTLSAKVRYNIEVGFDFAYLEVNGTKVPTSLSNSSVDPNGIDGHSSNNWVTLTANLSSFADQTVTIGFGYFTDGGVQGATGAFPAGISIDEIAITGLPTDGAESDAGWSYTTNGSTGFHVTTGSEQFSYFNAYLAENRQYTGYDDSLRLGPYNFGFPSMPNKVEHFPYQDGVLIWYWDSSYDDNNVGDHPGGGPDPPDRLASADPPLGRQRGRHAPAAAGVSTRRSRCSRRTRSRVHNPAGGAATSVPSQPGVSVFDDLQSWWVSGDPGDAPGNGRYQAEWNSVNVPKTGTQIRIQSETKGGFTQIEVRPSK